ncbi:MAG TPA: CatB-related O-acetyltransferase [Opitutaceae bacterium]|nr:CatB-related O-acetyltransferase [Opitutaceae bacterium]
MSNGNAFPSSEFAPTPDSGSLRSYLAPGAVVRDRTTGIEHPIKVCARAEIYKNTVVGRYTYLKPGAIIYPNTTVGRFCSIGRGVHIGPHTHPTNFLSTHPFQFYAGEFKEDAPYQDVRRVPFDMSARRTSVGHDVWIGTNAIVMPGVTIGHGAIVGAGSIVTHDVPPYAIVVGTPARVLRYRFEEETVAALLELEWWNLPLHELQALPFDDIASCLRQLKEKAAAPKTDASLPVANNHVNLRCA